MTAMQQINTRYRVDLPTEHACCETNYARVLRLLPALAQHDQHAVGVFVRGQLSRVVFDVSDRATYTTALQVRIEQPAPLPTFCFDVRLYHDVNMAEVVACQRQQQPAPQQAYPNRHMQQPDEKAQWNRFFGDWLAYCQRHGHSLQPVALRAMEGA